MNGNTCKTKNIQTEIKLVDNISDIRNHKANTHQYQIKKRMISFFYKIGNGKKAQRTQCDTINNIYCKIDFHSFKSQTKYGRGYGKDKKE